MSTTPSADTQLPVSHLIDDLLEALQQDQYHLLGQYDLRLMSIDKIDDLPNEERSVVIVALVGDEAHIRIFDASGNQVLSKTEAQLVACQELADLKKRLNSTPFPVESNLSRKERKEILEKATSTAGHTFLGLLDASREEISKSEPLFLVVSKITSDSEMKIASENLAGDLRELGSSLKKNRVVVRYINRSLQKRRFVLFLKKLFGWLWKR